MNEVEKALPIRVVGKIQFGSGAIDATGVSEQAFTGALDIVASPIGRTTLSRINYLRQQRKLPEIPGIMNLPSNCMDGRKNGTTLAGNDVLLGRPKLPGGATLYATDIFSIMGLFDEKTNMLERFIKVVASAPGAASMHLMCGMAGKGSAPVLIKLHDHLQDAIEFAGVTTMGGLIYTPRDVDEIMAGLDATIARIQSDVGVFHEASMIAAVEKSSKHGNDALLQLQIDTTHPNNSHKEGGLVVLMGRPDEIMVKKPVVDNSNVADVFYYNMGYSDAVLTHHLGTLDQQRLERARKIGILLPFAAVGALGKNQWVGSVGSYNAMLAAAA